MCPRGFWRGALVVHGTHAAIHRQRELRVFGCGFGHQGGDRLGKRGVLVERVQQHAKTLQVQHRHIGTARPRKQNPGAGDCQGFVASSCDMSERTRCIGCARAGSEATPGNGEQRFIGRRRERRQRFRRVRQKVLGGLLRFHGGGSFGLCEKFEFQPRVDIARANLGRLRFGIEAQIDQPRDQRIGQRRTRFPGNTEAHAPDQFELALNQCPGEFLLQREEFDVEIGEAPALALGFGPRCPDSFEIASVLSLDLRTKPVIGKTHARTRVHGGIGRLGQTRGRIADVPMRAGCDKRGALDLGGKLWRNQHCRAHVEPGRQPGTVGLWRNFRSRWVGDRQPDFVVAVRAAVIEPYAVDGAGLMVEQQETTVIGDIRDHPAARAQRLLRVVDERNEALLLKGHGRSNGSCCDNCNFACAAIVPAS